MEYDTTSDTFFVKKTQGILGVEIHMVDLVIGECNCGKWQKKKFFDPMFLLFV